MRKRSFRSSFRIVGTLATLIAAGGCRSSDREIPADANRTEQVEHVLRDLIRSEGRRPIAPVTLHDIRTWSDFSWEDPNVAHEDSDRRKTLSIDDILNTHTQAPRASATAAKRNPQALSLYSSGRLKLADNQAQEALKDLQSAVTIDPQASELHRAIGDTLSALGRKNEALRSYERAVALGLDEAPIHRTIAAEHIRNREWDKAVESLVACLKAPDYKRESDLGVVARADLGMSLIESGYFAAAESVLQDVADESFTTLAASRFRAELTEVFRKRSDICVTCGDLALRQGDAERALIHYRNASNYPSADPMRIRLRFVLAHARAGRPAHGAQIVLNQYSDPKLRSDPRLAAALVRLASVPSLRHEIEEAIDDLSLDDDLPHSLRANLLKSAAQEAVDIDARRSALRKLVTLDPADGSGIVRLLATYSSDKPSEIASEIEDLAQRHVEHSDVLASAVIAFGRGVSGIIDELQGSGDIGPATVHALLLSATGDPASALREIREVSADSPAKQRTIAQLASELGLDDLVEQTLESLKSDDPSTLRARAIVLEMSGRMSEAAQVAKEALKRRNTPSQTIGMCKLLIECGDCAAAESELQSLIRRDDQCEIAYELLVRIYAPGSPAADEGKLNSLARTMRQRIGDGRIMRTIQAQDALNRALWAQANRAFTELLDENFESPAVLESLVVLWERCAKAEPEITAAGESLLRSRSAVRPDSVLLNLALARVLTATDRAAEAESVLAGKIDSIAFPELRRQHEKILRDHLGKADDADRLAIERLDAAPKCLNTAMEWFELYAERGDFDSAAAKFAETFPKSSRIGSQSAARIATALTRVAPDRIIARGVESGRSISDLFDRLIQAQVGLPPALHVIRLEILARSSPDDAIRLIKATNEFVAIQPDMRGPAVNQMFRWISDASDASAGLAFIRLFVDQSPDTDLTGYLIQQTCTAGTADDAQALIKNLRDLESIRKVLLRVNPGAVQSDSAENKVRAELSYLIALEFAARDLESDARDLYRLALNFDPSHGWSANNLGFGMLEESGPTEESIRLLELANAVLPAEPSVIDSLAWLRYKQGHIETDQRGEGALSLIRRSVALDQDPSADVLEHAGDIHWVAGQPDKAIEFWTASAARADADAMIFKQRGITGSRYDHLEQVGQRAKSKADAARKGDQPDLVH